MATVRSLLKLLVIPICLVVTFEAIGDLEVVTQPVVVGRPSLFHLNVYSPGPFNVTVDYGDGGALDYYRYSVMDVDHLDLPYQLSFEHVFAHCGTFTVLVNFTDEISHHSQTVDVTVQDPAAADLIRVELPGPALLPVLDEVVVTACVNLTEVGAQFSWNFGDGTGQLWTQVQRTNASCSRATHKYGIAGTYVVHVTVTGSAFHQPVTARLPQPLAVVERIRDVYLQPVLPRFVASLRRRMDGTYSTDAVAFEAHTDQGSHVEFDFDFGDGTKLTVVGEFDALLNGAAALETHAYQEEGLYAVCVSAKNPLGSRVECLQQPFLVQMLPEGLRLNKGQYCIRVGEPTQLRALISSGSDVLFDWHLGNERLLNAGPEITHTFNTVGTFVVTVEAYNNATDLAYDEPKRESSSTKVTVHNVLQDVQVEIVGYDAKNESVVIFSTDDTVRFVAQVFPPPVGHHTYDWTWGPLPKQRRRTLTNHMEETFKEFGQYSLSVTVANCVSSASSSAPVDFAVVEKLQRLDRVRQQPSSLLHGHNGSFEALHWFGSNLTYEWNFGDGTPALVTTSRRAWHAFVRTGEYVVTVKIHNVLSNGSLSTIVFVLDQTCDKPLITVIGLRDDMKVYGNEDLRLEADVETNCAITQEVVYRWSIFGRFADFAFHRRLLLVSANLLSPGNYSLHLKVQMNGTIVHSNVSFNFQVIESPLNASIAGGSIRTMARHDNITLTGKMIGVDPYKMNTTRFMWTCTPLLNSKSKCFSTPKSQLKWNQSDLSFPASALSVSSSKFLFSFRVQSGHQVSTALQVLQFSPAPKVLHVDLFCQSCHGVFVSKHDRIALYANCLDCGARTVFEWQLWLVLDGNQNLPISQYDCVQADGSTFFYTKDNDNNNSSQHFLPDANVGASMSPNGKGGSRNDTRSTLQFFTEGKTQIPFRGKSHRFAKNRQENEFVQGRSRKVPLSDFSSPVEGIAKPIQPVENHWRHVKGMMTTLLNNSKHSSGFDQITEGLPGEAGSAPRRNHRVILLENTYDNEGSMSGRSRSGRGSGINLQVSNENRKMYLSQPDRVRPLKDRDMTILSARDFIDNKDWNLIHLLPTDTTTGFNQETFVIKPGILKPGRMYAVVLNVQDRGNPRLQGKAVQEVRMFHGPGFGRCTIQPKVGYEYITSFKLDCLEWRGSNHNQLFYELVYILNSSETPQVIRYGLDNNLKFSLPAGLASNDYTVFLNVAVQQKRGGHTDVCTISVKVLPLEKYSNSTIEEIICKEVFHSVSALSVHLAKDEISAALQRVQVIACILKTRYSSKSQNKTLGEVDTSTRPIWCNLRSKLMDIIATVDIITEEQATLAFTAVHSLIEINDEVHCNLIETASLVTKTAGKMWLSPSSCTPFCVQQFHTFIQLFSTLLGNLHNFASSDAGFLRDRYADLFNGYQRNLITAIGVRLLSHFTGEVPIVVQTQYFSIKAFCQLVSADVINLKMLQLNISLRFQSHNSFSSCLCLQVLRFTYGSLWKINGTAMDSIPSVVLHFSTCDSNPIWNISRLCLSEPVIVDIPSQIPLKNNGYIFGTLQQQTMNIHTFKISQQTSNLTMFISIEFQEDLKNSFPILLLLSSSQMPCDESCVFMKKINDIRKDLIVTIPIDELSGTDRFYLGLVSANYKTRLLKPRDRKQVNYSLDLEIVECFQRDHYSHMWTSHGCQVDRDSLMLRDHIRCRCDQLANYSARIYRPHSEVAVTHVLRASVNPVIPVVLSLITIVFITALLLSMLAVYPHEHVCGTIILKHNHDSNYFSYLVTVQTGYWPNSATSAKVFIILFGENGMSEQQELSGNGEYEIHCQGSSNSFILKTSAHLGHIWKVQVWHDNSGASPSWFLCHIIIQDLSTGKNYYFNCDKWLAVEAEDAKIEREIYLTENSFLFTQAFQSNFWRLKMRIDIWSSMFKHPPPDHFLHSERVVCCFLNISFYLAMSALWCYWTQNEPFLSSSVFLQAPLIISFLGLPLQFIPSVFFHFTKLKTCASHSSRIALVKKTTSKVSNYPTCEEISLESLNKSTSNFEMNFDQPLEMWELQDWAQRQWRKHVSINNLGEQDLETTDMDTCSDFSNASDELSSGFEDCVNYASDDVRIVHHQQRPSKADLRQCLNGNGERSMSITFPFWSRYIMRGLCCIGTGFALTITFWLTARFPVTLFVRNLEFTLMSVAFANFLFLPGLIAALASIMCVKYNNLIQNECVCQSACSSSVLREECYKSSADKSNDAHLNKVTFRQSSRFSRLARPPGETELLQTRKRILHHKVVWSFVKQLVECICILIPLLVVLICGISGDSYQLNSFLKQMFHSSKDTSKINCSIEWYSWLNSSVIPVLYSTTELEAEFENSQTYWYIGESSNVLIGNPVLYQNNFASNPLSTVKQAFHNGSSWNSSVVLLPRERLAVQKLMIDLKNSEWFHTNISKLGIQFLVLNVPTNLLSSVQFGMDFFPTGGINQVVEVVSVHMISEENLSSDAVAASKVILAFILLWSINALIDWLTERPRCCHVSLELILQMMFIVSLAIYFICHIQLSNCSVSTQYVLEHSQYLNNVNLTDFALWNKVCHGIWGFALFLHTFRCLFLFQGTASFIKFKVLFKSAYKEIFFSMISVCCVIISYSFLGSLWELNTLFDFQRPGATVFTLICILTRNLKIGSFIAISNVFVPLYIGTFIALFYFMGCVGMKTILKASSLNSTPVDSPLFTMKDVWVTLLEEVKTYISSFKNIPPKKHLIDIPYEFMLGELESQIEDVLFRVNQLCKYDGVTIRDDLGYSSLANYNLNSSLDHEDDTSCIDDDDDNVDSDSCNSGISFDEIHTLCNFISAEHCSSQESSKRNTHSVECNANGTELVTCSDPQLGTHKFMNNAEYLCSLSNASPSTSGVGQRSAVSFVCEDGIEACDASSKAEESHSSSHCSSGKRSAPTRAKLTAAKNRKIRRTQTQGKGRDWNELELDVLLADSNADATP